MKGQIQDLDAIASIPFGEIELPLSLLQAHEAGTVVFFVGAGVSVPAGLPNFRMLVEELRNRFAALRLSDIVTKEMDAGFLDRAINILETTTVGGRATIRKAIAELLLDVDAEVAIQHTVHQQLLKLSTTHATAELLSACRIVTTNQDPLFEAAARVGGSADTVRAYVAPALPVAKRNWSGRIYIHGLLEDKHLTQSAEDIVFSSADFGRAYLGEAWAANFLRDLAANHTIVFVGYSLDDPLLRYISEALAADDLVQNGSALHRRYAFADYNSSASKGPNSAAAISQQWWYKGVTALPFDTSEQGFTPLSEALSAWSAFHADGLAFRRSIIDRDAATVPLDATAAGTRRVLWALDEPTGTIAKHFAAQESPPPLEWASLFFGTDLLAKHRGPRVFGGDHTGKPIHVPLFQSTKLHSGLTVFANSRVSAEWQYDKTHAQQALLPWMLAHAEDDRMAFLLISRGPVVDRWFGRKILERTAEEDFPKQLRVAYELWLEARIDNHANILGRPDWHDGSIMRRSSTSRLAHLYEAMRLSFTIGLNDYSSHKKHIAQADGSEDAAPLYYRIKIEVDRHAVAYTEDAYAMAYELETDPLLFCRKAEGIFLLNQDYTERLREVGLYHDRLFHRGSIEMLRLDKPYGYNYLLPVLPLRNAVTAVLPDREAEVFTEASRWLSSSVLAMRLLGVWAMTKVGHRDWTTVLDWLYEVLPGGTVPLFDHDYRQEVPWLLEAFAKTAYATHPDVAQRLEDQILTANSLPFPDSDRNEALVAYNRYRHLRTLTDAGAKLGDAAALFITETEANDATANPSVEQEAIRRKVRRMPAGLLLGAKPKTSSFSESEPSDWPTLLLTGEDNNYDDWGDIVTTRTAEALQALLEAERSRSVVASRWGHLLYGDKLGSLSKDEFRSLLMRLRRATPAELKDLSWSLGSFYAWFPAEFNEFTDVADQLLLLAAPQATAPLGDHDYDKNHGAVTLPFGAVRYLHRTSSSGHRPDASFSDMLLKVGERFDDLAIDMRVLWRYELTRSFGIITQRAPQVVKTFLAPAVNLCDKEAINHAVWQGIGAHLFPHNYSEEALALIRPYVKRALVAVPGEAWRDTIVKSFVQLNIYQIGQLVPDAWFRDILADSNVSTIVSTLDVLAWQAEFGREEAEDTEVKSTFWETLGPFFENVFPKSGQFTRGQELTPDYLRIILCAQDELPAAAIVLGPYITALPYESQEGLRMERWLSQFSDRTDILEHASEVLRILSKAFVDRRYAGDNVYQDLLDKLKNAKP